MFDEVELLRRRGDICKAYAHLVRKFGRKAAIVGAVRAQKPGMHAHALSAQGYGKVGAIAAGNHI